MLRLNRDRSSWLLALFLLLGVLAPSGSVLWFMNDAVRSQGESARGSPRLIGCSFGSCATGRTTGGERAPALDESAPGGFQAALKAANADSAILLDARGVAIYPSLPAAPVPDPTLGRADWAQAESLERAPNRLADAAADWERLAR